MKEKLHRGHGRRVVKQGRLENSSPATGKVRPRRWDTRTLEQLYIGLVLYGCGRLKRGQGIVS